MVIAMRQQSGIALITAILVVAIAAIASAAILGSANIAIRRTANLQESEVGWWYATGVEAWVKTILDRDQDENKFDSLRDVWAMPVVLPVDEGTIRGGVVDLQGRYNLNNLSAPDPNEYEQQVKIFARILRYAEVAEEFQARAIAAAIHDWTDADSEPWGADGIEDSEYLRASPPYRAANRRMAGVSELLAVRGIDKKAYAKLSGLFCALPQYGTPINVNTAPPAVLLALSSGPTPELELFLKERLEKPVESQGQISARLGPGFNEVMNMLTVSSSFFMLNAEVFIGSGRTALYSFYFRPSPGNTAVYGRSTDIE